MPDRIIRESICTSETIDALSWFEECFWQRLTVCVDDYGRFDARPQILKNRLFPLKENVTRNAVEDALKKLTTVGLVTTYVCDGKQYLQLVTWSKYQRIRAKTSKYPEPTDCDLERLTASCGHLTAICGNAPQNAPVSVSVSESVSESEKREGYAPTRGEFKNVLLDGQEHEKLVDSLGDIGAAEYIERLSAYLAQTGRRYKSHYAAILNWWRRDGKPVKRSACSVSAVKPDAGRDIPEDITAEELF